MFVLVMYVDKLIITCSYEKVIGWCEKKLARIWYEGHNLNALYIGP